MPLRKLIYAIFTITFLVIIVQYAIIGWIGFKAYDSYDENNQSVGATLGAFYKDFKEASQ